MFTTISWVNYIVVVALLVASWYLFVAFRFYLDEIKEIVTGSRKLQFWPVSKKKETQMDYDLKDFDLPESASPISTSSFEESDTTFRDVDALVERLKFVVADAIKRKFLKQELLDYLRLVLREYPTVKNSAFRSSVSEFIVSECTKLELINLLQTEVEELWDDKI